MRNARLHASRKQPIHGEMWAFSFTMYENHKKVVTTKENSDISLIKRALLASLLNDRLLADVRNCPFRTFKNAPLRTPGLRPSTKVSSACFLLVCCSIQWVRLSSLFLGSGRMCRQQAQSTSVGSGRFLRGSVILSCRFRASGRSERDTERPCLPKCGSQKAFPSWRNGL